MTEFISRSYGNKEFEVIIKTDSADHFKATEQFARELIDHGKPSNWIPVTERLPEFIPDNARKYLTLCTGAIDGKPYCELLWFGRRGWYRYDSEWGDVWYKNVTHWMPLPEPPTEVSYCRR